MAFRARAGVPVITWGELHALNALVKPYEDECGSKIRPLDRARRHHAKWLARGLFCCLAPREHVILSAITARTFGFGKLIETVPLSIFTEGMHDPNNPEAHHLDEDGVPYFAGTSLNISTVRKALSELEQKHLIQRFQVLGVERHTDAFMPVSVATAAMMLGAYFALDDLPSSVQACIDGRERLTELEEMILYPWLKKQTAEQLDEAA